MPDYDVVIVGAGAAGLAAAAALRGRDLSVCIVDARDRIGGRIYTRDAPELPMPIDLGAEFIHGLAPSTTQCLNNSNNAKIDAPQTRWVLDRSELRSGDALFASMTAGLRKLSRPRRDLSFLEFLNGPAKRTLTARERAFAKSLVEGFDAADATRVSTLETLDEWAGTSAADAPTFRPQGGYVTLIRALSAACSNVHTSVRLSTIVREVRWHRGSVTIEVDSLGRASTITARQAIITLPLGVLQLPEQSPHAVRFTPTLRKDAALAHLGVGPVIKLVFLFHTAFWESVQDGKLRDAAFLQAPGKTFQTFWTTLPVRTPLLIAWSAGPNAARLGGHDEAAIVDCAIDELDTLFGKSVRVRDHLVAAYLHDWQADPFACGAYSNVLVDGRAARKQLAKSLSQTLFFAGEATDTEGEAGTVAGALQSGKRAAREVIAAQKRKTR